MKMAQFFLPGIALIGHDNLRGQGRCASTSKIVRFTCVTMAHAQPFATALVGYEVERSAARAAALASLECAARAVARLDSLAAREPLLKIWKQHEAVIGAVAAVRETGAEADLADVIALCEAVTAGAGAFPAARVVGVCLNTLGLSDEAARDAVAVAAAETGLPATDAVRFGVAAIGASIFEAR